MPYLHALRGELLGRREGHLDAVTERAAAPVIAKYTGVLAAADIEDLTMTTTFAIMQSLRLDKVPAVRFTPENPHDRPRLRTAAAGPAAAGPRPRTAILLR